LLQPFEQCLNARIEPIGREQVLAHRQQRLQRRRDLRLAADFWRAHRSLSELHAGGLLLQHRRHPRQLVVIALHLGEFFESRDASAQPSKAAASLAVHRRAHFVEAAGNEVQLCAQLVGECRRRGAERTRLRIGEHQRIGLA